MKRQIKFRAWDSEKKIMYQVDEIRLNNPGNNAHVFIKGRGWLSAGKGTLREFTGLHDNNGKEIYEGDIVKQGSKIYYEVYWSNLGSGGWWFADMKKGNLHADTIKLDDLEIIGNIFSNMEKS